MGGWEGGREEGKYLEPRKERVGKKKAAERKVTLPIIGVTFF